MMVISGINSFFSKKFDMVTNSKLKIVEFSMYSFLLKTEKFSDHIAIKPNK